MTTRSIRQLITMEKYKTKAIQPDEDMLTHATVHPDISRHIYLGTIKHIQTNSEHCVTLTYSKP